MNKCCDKCEEPEEELFEGNMITNGEMICRNKDCPCHIKELQDKEKEIMK